MSGTIGFDLSGGVACVTLAHPARRNAMTRAMWRELRLVFDAIQDKPAVRCVVLSGEAGHFCAGGDISEYVDFRFDATQLRAFHEHEVWGGLRAMLDCDVPIIAKIAGNCMGAGVEIASCCDLRVAATSARFGAPIAKLGFPMAPKEAALVTRALGSTVARQMLLAASVFDACDLKTCGFLSQVEEASTLAVQVEALAQRVCALAPNAARLNKQTLRRLGELQLPQWDEGVSSRPAGPATADPYAYASSAEHREGVMAFLEKRPPLF